MEENKELVTYMKRIAEANRPGRIIVNAILNGIFVSVGATIGFTIILLALAGFLSQAKSIPLIDQIIENSKLDELIQNQIEKITPNTK